MELKNYYNFFSNCQLTKIKKINSFLRKKKKTKIIHIIKKIEIFNICINEVKIFLMM